MATVLVAIIFGALVFGGVGAGLILMNYFLKKKGTENYFNGFKAAIIPEVEGMTKRIMNDSMDLVMDKTVEMTKKMMASNFNED